MLKWYLNLYEYKYYDQRITQKPKLVNFTLYICNNCPQKSTPRFELILNSSWSNDKSKGQISMKTYKSDIHGIWLNKESNETKFEQIGSKIKETSLFKNQQKSAMKFGRSGKISNSWTLITQRLSHKLLWL